MSDPRALYHKFNVTRTDGSDAEGQKHHGCRYFVLDLDHDEAARAILPALADAYDATGRHPLAAALRDLTPDGAQPGARP